MSHLLVLKQTATAAAAAAGSAQPLYRPFLILFLILLIAIIGAVLYYLWRRTPEDAAHPGEMSSTEQFKELVRSILTATLTAGFIVLTFEDKIDAGIFGNTYAIIIAFWFGQQIGKKEESKRNGNGPAVAPPAPTP